MEAAGDSRAAPDALFSEAFGAAPGARPRAIPLELELDGRPSGLVSALLPRGKSQQEPIPQAAPLLAALKGALQDPVHGRLAAAVDAQGNLSLQALRGAGLEASYDPSRLAIILAVPPQLRRTSVRSVSSSADTDAPPDALATSRLSGFLNVRLGQDLSWSHSGGPSARQPWRLGLESAVNLSGWVLEGRADLTEGAQGGLSRGDVRLVRDFPSRSLRFVAGDIAGPGTRFLTPRSLLGLSVARNFSLDPTRRILPEEAVSFFLERPSRVDVLVNGRPLQTLQLPAGPHDLNGLLLDSGSNEVELVITDDVGAQQRVTKRVGLASGQLAQGISEFAYSLGVPQQPGVAGRTQDWSQPSLHLLHRQGLSRALTLGAALQLDTTSQAVSVEPLWATFLGSLSPSVALSHRAGSLGHAAGVRYELQRAGRSGSPGATFGMGGEYRSASFSAPGSLEATLGPSYVLSSSYGRGLGAGFNAKLSGEVSASGAALARGYAASFVLSKGFRNGLTLMLDATARSQPLREQELRGRLNLVWSWTDAQRTVQALTDVSRGGAPTRQLSVSQQLQTGSTRIHASAGVAQAGQSRRLSESLSVQGQRAEAQVTHQLESVGGVQAHMGSTVNARVGMALVFADGIFALSRPVNDSFAIVAPHRTLKGQWIGVNPRGEGYAGAADWLGPAVVTDLQPYAWSRLRVAAPSLPLGYSLGPDAHALRPTYRSGTVVRVGEPGSVLLRGVLHDTQGAPIALTSGTVARTSEGPEAAEAFFTNRTGRFVLPALRPGSYLLQLDGSVQATRFSIPEGSVGVFELGTVVISQGNDAPAHEGAELVAREVRLRRNVDAPLAASESEPAPTVATAVLATVRGRLYGDRNANGLTEPDEPVFANVRVGAAGVAATTDKEGLFELKGLSGSEALLRVETPEALPFGMVPADKRIALGTSEVTADLLVPAARFPMAPSGPFTLTLHEGKVRAVQLEKATFPLAAWVAGLPLSRGESQRLAKLAERVHESADMRLLVVARAQTQGALRGAVKRAQTGGRALQRYLQATQLVPGKKLGLTVVEALPGFDSPLGEIDLVLVRIEGPAGP